MAQTFSFVDEEKGIDLSRYARLDTLITVVDAFDFDHAFGNLDCLPDRLFNAADPADQRTIVNLAHRAS